MAAGKALREKMPRDRHAEYRRASKRADPVAMLEEHGQDAPPLSRSHPLQVMRTSCTRAQMNAFRKGGEAVLAEMGKALNQEAVAYETRQGLTILTL